MIQIELSQNGRGALSATVDVPLSAASAWGQMRDFRRFTTHDLFHRRMHVSGGEVRIGAPIVIEHRFLGLRIDRIGRILAWREGVGYCFSDLSKRGRNVGFPHIYGYNVAPTGPESCRIDLTVRGRWTASWLPRIVSRLWLRWVVGYAAGVIRIEMLRFALWKRRRASASHVVSVG